MIIWRFLKVFIVALIIFVVFNFLLTNLDAQTLGYPIHFRFNIPPILYLESIAFPVGSLILIAFCLGMVVAAFMGAVSLFYRTKELKAKNRTIRELEREIDELRSLYAGEKNKGVSPYLMEEENTLENPRIE